MLFLEFLMSVLYAFPLEFGAMVNDFMGLNANDSVSVKEELAKGDCPDSGFARSLGVPWSLKTEHGTKPSKMESGSNVLEAMYKQQSGDVKNFGRPEMNQQFPYGNPLVTSHPILPFGATFAGMTKHRISTKTSTSAQLTIFYGGTVSVFDDISPEKAQAILFLTGSGFAPLNTVNQNMPPGSGLPSPESVSSHPIDQSGVPAVNSDAKASSTISMATALVNKAELPGAISSIGTMMSAAVPQACRPSLARFLEKRRERIMNGAAAPYKFSDNAPDCNSFGFLSSV